MATGRKTVVVGQVIDPTVWGNPLWDQSVQTFTSAADRTAQFPTPLQGAVTWLEDVKRLQIWDGAAWRTLSYAQASMVQYGTAVVTLGGTVGVVTFPVPFTALPIALTVSGAGPATSVVVNHDSRELGRLLFGAFNGGTQLTTGAVRVQWVAYGPF